MDADAELARLLRAAIAGDEGHYDRFLREAACRLRSFACKRAVTGGPDPEDIVQETLLAIHLKRHTWRQDGPVLPWIYAIARHKLIDLLRRRGYRHKVELDDIAGIHAETESDTMRDRELGRALNALTPGQRDVVSAICVEGRSIGETAIILGKSDTAVRVALHRGLRTISRKFGLSAHGYE